MKLILLLLIIAISSTAQAETVKKWIDEQGRIHYGNSNAAIDAETVEIMDTFDEKAYQEGVQRYEEMEKFLDEFEQERQTGEERLDEEKRKKSESLDSKRKLRDKHETPSKRLVGPYGRGLPYPLKTQP